MRVGIASVLAAIMAIGAAVAATDAAPADSGYKIGVVNLKQVIDNYEKAQEVRQNLEEEAAANNEKIDEIKSRLEQAQQRYQEQSDSMSEEDRVALEDQISADRSLLQAELRRLQSQVDRKQQRQKEQLFGDIRDAVSEIGAQENFHLILEAGKANPSGVLYHSTTLDITTRVTQHLNANYQQ